MTTENIKYAESATDAIQRFLFERFEAFVGQNKYVGDPAFVGLEKSLPLWEDTKIITGRIQTAIPFTNTYVVRTSDTGTQLLCSAVIDGSSSGGSAAANYTIGDHVVVLANRLGGQILGERARTIHDPTDSYSDFIVSGGGFNFYASPLYSYYYTNMKDGKHLPAFGKNRPYDVLSGDHTISSVTGNMLHIDDEMAFLRSSELCGVHFFRDTGHTRLSGESLEQESLAHRLIHGLDNGETYVYGEGYYYPWEMFGLKEAGSFDDNFKEQEDRGFMRSGVDTYLYPTEDNMLPVARTYELGGFLGQGHQHIVVSPQWKTQDKQTTDLSVYEQGLAKHYTGIDGTILIESTKQVLLAKTANMIVPRVYGDPTELADEVTPNKLPSDRRPDQNAFSDYENASLLPQEHLATVSNWQTIVSALGHKNVAIQGSNEEGRRADFDLSDKESPAAGEAILAEIDENRDKVKIEQILSLFGILPNGDIVIQNGLGASIKLSGGRVSITGTSVDMSSGKALSLRGRNVSIKGYRTTELVSSRGKLRIKSEKDMEFLAANGGKGGMIFDHRGTDSISEINNDPEASNYAGIVVKSQLGHVSILGGSILMKTGPEAAGSRTERIIMDAGQSTIALRAGAHRRYTQSSFFDHFGPTGDVKATNEYHENISILPGTVVTLGHIVSGGFCMVVSGVYTARGAFATGETRYTPYVHINPQPSLITNYISQVTNLNDNSTDRGKTFLDELKADFEEKNKPLNSVTIRKTSFGFPSSDKYGTKDFKQNQPYWEQLPIRNKVNWVEPSVKWPNSGGQETYPWPGKENWQANSLLVAKKPSNLVNLATQRSLEPLDSESQNKYGKSKRDDYQIEYVAPSKNTKVIDNGSDD